MKDWQNKIAVNSRRVWKAFVAWSKGSARAFRLVMAARLKKDGPRVKALWQKSLNLLLNLVKKSGYFAKKALIWLFEGAKWLVRRLGESFGDVFRFIRSHWPSFQRGAGKIWRVLVLGFGKGWRHTAFHTKKFSLQFRLINTKLIKWVKRKTLSGCGAFLIILKKLGFLLVRGFKIALVHLKILLGKLAQKCRPARWWPVLRDNLGVLGKKGSRFLNAAFGRMMKLFLASGRQIGRFVAFCAQKIKSGASWLFPLLRINTIKGILYALKIVKLSGVQIPRFSRLFFSFCVRAGQAILGWLHQAWNGSARLITCLIRSSAWTVKKVVFCLTRLSVEVFRCSRALFRNGFRIVSRGGRFLIRGIRVLARAFLERGKKLLKGFLSVIRCCKKGLRAFGAHGRLAGIKTGRFLYRSLKKAVGIVKLILTHGRRGLRRAIRFCGAGLKKGQSFTAKLGKVFWLFIRRSAKAFVVFYRLLKQVVRAVVLVFKHLGLGLFRVIQFLFQAISFILKGLGTFFHIQRIQKIFWVMLFGWPWKILRFMLHILHWQDRVQVEICRKRDRKEARGKSIRQKKIKGFARKTLAMARVFRWPLAFLFFILHGIVKIGGLSSILERRGLKIINGHARRSVHKAFKLQGRNKGLGLGLARFQFWLSRLFHSERFMRRGLNFLIPIWGKARFIHSIHWLCVVLLRLRARVAGLVTRPLSWCAQIRRRLAALFLWRLQTEKKERRVEKIYDHKTTSRLFRIFHWETRWLEKLLYARWIKKGYQLSIFLVISLTVYTFASAAFIRNRKGTPKEMASVDYTQKVFLDVDKPASVIHGATMIGGRFEEVESSEQADFVITDNLEGRQPHLAAWEATALVVGESNPLYNVSEVQVQKILAGEISNWKEIGGLDKPINLYVHGRSLIKPTVRHYQPLSSHEKQVVLKRDPAALLLLSASQLEINDKILLVDYNAPSKSHVLKKRYPFASLLKVKSRRKTLPLTDLSKKLELEELTSLVSGGDVMWDRGVGNRIQGRGYGFLIAELKKLFQSGDISMVNLENPISNRGEKYNLDKVIFFRGSPLYTGILTEMGINLVSLANNHIFDYGMDALVDTLAILNRLGISQAGYGKNLADALNGPVFELSGKKVRFMAYNSIYPYNVRARGDMPGISMINPATLSEEIREARQGVDLVYVSCHAGLEYLSLPEPEKIALYRQMIDAGADAVLGHHPHVIQPIEIYRGKPIIYSMGNLIFDQYRNELTRDEMVVELNYYNGRLTHIFKHFFRMNEEFQPIALKNREVEALLARIDFRSAQGNRLAGKPERGAE